MGDKKQDDGAMGVASFALFIAVFAIFCAGFVFVKLAALKVKECRCDPVPTPAPCCEADECRKELALVDTRFGDVWDELVEVQEQLAKLKPCGCGPVKECSCEPSKHCACSDKPACECKPAAPEPKVLLPTYRKRCR